MSVILEGRETESSIVRQVSYIQLSNNKKQNSCIHLSTYSFSICNCNLHRVIVGSELTSVNMKASLA